ncbi:hypothetical protein ACFX1W_006999 [Malus domestica]
MSPRLLRHRFPDLLFLPRLFFSVTAAKDLVRLLQDLVHLPKFRAIWKDLVLNRGEFKAQGFSVGKPEASSGMIFLEVSI